MQILKPLLKCFSSLYNLEIESLLFLIKSYQAWKKRQKVFLTFEFSKSTKEFPWSKCDRCKLFCAMTIVLIDWI